MATTSQHSTRRGRLGRWGAVLTILVGLLAWTMPGLKEWTGDWSLDLTQHLRHSVEATNVVIVAMDELSFDRLDQNRRSIWDRQLHTQLLRRLQEDGARLVVFDILFDEPWPEESVDRELADALESFGDVVLAGIVVRTKLGQYGRLDTSLEPVPTLGAHATIGYAELPDEDDRVLRRHFGYPNFPGLAWKAIGLLQAPPGTIDQARYLNYYGGGQVVPKTSYFLAWANAVPAGYFTDKVVFVGADRSRREDQTRPGDDLWRTPFTRGTARWSAGVEIQALAFLNLWRHDWLERFSRAQEFMVLLGAGCVFGFGLVWLRPGWALAGVAVGWMALAGWVVWLTWKTTVWFGWLNVAFVQMPFAFGWSLYSQVLCLVKTQPDALGEAPKKSLKEFEFAGEGESQDGKPMVPDHEVLARIGRGGYGEVWLARNALGAFHAVKVVHRKSFTAGAPFDRELRGVEKFMPLSRAHPGWVPILHVGKTKSGDSFYYVMEAADDQTTGARIDPAQYHPRTVASDLQKTGAYSLQDCVELGKQLAAALEYLHGHHLIHRDIKPSNIVYQKGVPRFVDIGLVTEEAGPNLHVSYVGTLDYMPPEGPGTALGDIYSLGKVLYSVVSGLEASLYPEMPTAMLDSAHETGLLELYEIVGKACAPDFRQRYQSAAELRMALARMAESLNKKQKDAGQALGS